MKKCPFCENLIPSDSSFCEYCGEKVNVKSDGILSEEDLGTANSAQEVTDNNSGKRHNWVRTFIVAVCILAIAFTSVMVGIEIKNQIDSFDVLTGFHGGFNKDYYGLVAPQISTTDIEECIYLNSRNQTYSRLVGNYLSQGGYYQIKGNELILKEYDGTTHKYSIMMGTYISGSKNNPVTKIPKKNKFNATVEDNNGHTVEFHSDGTAKFDGKSASYEREGFVIYIYLVDDSITLTDYVIDGYLCSDTYLYGSVSSYTGGLAEYADLYYRQKYDKNYSNKNVDRYQALKLEREYSNELEDLVIHEYQ